MNTPEQQLSESLLAACKAAGIEKPRFIIQQEQSVWHVDVKPEFATSYWAALGGVGFIKLDHPPYADDWQDSLMEWVYHVADTSKKIDEAIKMAYQKHLEKGDGLCWSRAGDYRQGWQDALVWKGSSDD